MLELPETRPLASTAEVEYRYTNHCHHLQRAVATWKAFYPLASSTTLDSIMQSFRVFFTVWTNAGIEALCQNRNLKEQITIINGALLMESWVYEDSDAASQEVYRRLFLRVSKYYHERLTSYNRFRYFHLNDLGEITTPE